MSEYEQKRPERDVIDEGRARELSLARVRTLWVAGNDELARLAGAEPEAKPIVIHDLAGPPLFYDFPLQDEQGSAGVVRAVSRDDTGILVEDVIDAGVGRREPASFHRACHPDACLRTFTGSSRRDVERDQELAVANAALRTDNGAMAGRQEHTRRARFPAAAHAIGITREERTAEHRFVYRSGRESILSCDE